MLYMYLLNTEVCYFQVPFVNHIVEITISIIIDCRYNYPFSSDTFCFIFLDTTLFCAYRFRIIISSRWVDPFIIKSVSTTGGISCHMPFYF